MVRASLAIWLCLPGWFSSSTHAQSTGVQLDLQPESSAIWPDGIGGGFRKHAVYSGIALEAGFGNAAFGSTVPHDLALASVNATWVLSGVVCSNHWFRGNCEVTGELFGGAQYRPEYRYVVGLVPMFRYSFATGTRWIPFVNIGAGVTSTDIEGPDLNGNFEFCPQGGLGTHFLLRDNLALTVQCRALHLSNAGIREPNHGLNTQMFSAGITWFF